MKEIAGKCRQKTDILPKELNTKEGTLLKKDDIAKKLNRYFSNIGPKLAKVIPKSLTLSRPPQPKSVFRD